jgi:hypothetical protein
MVQSKSGSSDLVGIGGSQSAYQGSVIRETRSCPFIPFEIVDQRSSKNAFSA